MNTLIYLGHLHQSMGGIRQYSVALLKILANSKDNKYFVYHNQNDDEVITAIKGHSEFKLITDEDIHTQEIIYKRVPIYRFGGIPILNKIRIKRKFILKHDLTHFCKTNNIQIIHCPFQYIPKVEGVKLITTLHDVQEIHFPEFFTAEERAYRAVNYLDYLRRADAVIVSYDHVKRDLIKYFDVPEKNVETILLKMDKLWFEKFSDKDIVTLPSGLDSKRFLLYPANAWKHKNHIALINTLVFLRNEKNIKINLVFTGDFNSDNGQDLIRKTIELKIEDQITFLGIVKEEVLYSLYKKTVGVIISTLYEAGSFPLMESILLNVPVICSNVTSLPETIGDNKFVFNPTDIEDISQNLAALWNDENFRKENIRQIQIQAKKLKENNPLPTLQNLYADLIA